MGLVILIPMRAVAELQTAVNVLCLVGITSTVAEHIEVLCVAFSVYCVNGSVVPLQLHIDVMAGRCVVTACMLCCVGTVLQVVGLAIALLQTAVQIHLNSAHCLCQLPLCERRAVVAVRQC